MRFISCKTAFTAAALLGLGLHAAWARDTITITIPRHSSLTFVQRLNREGVLAVQKHDYAAAANLFYKAYLFDPSDPFTLNNLGYISELEGQLDRANKFYKLAAQQGSSANIDLSSVKSLKGQPMQAAFSGLQDVPMRVNRLNLEAVNLLSEGRAFEAAGLLQQALSLDPRDPFTLNNLGVAEEGAGDLGGAMKYFTAAAYSRSHDVVAVTQDRSWQGKSVGELAEANVMRLEGQSQGSDSRAMEAALLSEKGVSAENENDWPTAKRDFMQAYALDPTNAFSLNNRGYVAERDGDLESAQFFYQKAGQAYGSGLPVGLATNPSAKGQALSRVATHSRFQVDGALDVYSRERRGQPGAVELTPRGGAAAGTSAAPRSSAFPTDGRLRLLRRKTAVITKGLTPMSTRVAEFPPVSSLIYLSRLLLQPQSTCVCSAIAPDAPALMPSRDQFGNVLALAHLNHVDVRWLEMFLDLAREEHKLDWFQLASGALSSEKARIAAALNSLHEVCAAFQNRGHDVMVIKTLDHWPDFGSDMDLFTTAQPNEVFRLMTECFNARLAQRSWGDYLANKWNFLIPGLPEPIEIHVRRLGQTGEQVAIASALTKRAWQIDAGGYRFRVPSIPDRLIISTLQRMYRHFNIRLCDIVDTAAVADARLIDYDQLSVLAESAGVWEGVATYLAIVSDYVRGYRGTPLNLPHFVLDAARFRGAEIFYDKGFLRVPLMPHSARLYGSEMAHVLGRGELQNGVRLSLLPLLGTAAIAAQRITGSDKGIW